MKNNIKTETNSNRTDKLDPATVKPRYPALAKRGITHTGDVAGKPVFAIKSESVINMKSHFGAKKLCDGLTFTPGQVCVFGCKFCYVEALLRRNAKIRAILEETQLSFEEIVIDLENPAEVAKRFLVGARGPKYKDTKDQRVIYASPLVDVAATMSHVERTVEICNVILESTYWQIRLLSKSSLLGKIAEKIPTEYKNRMIYGFSTGTLDDEMAKIFEKGTALPSKRIDALYRLQDAGYRTFGMPCPTLPQRNYDEFAEQMAQTIRVDKCEHVWVEVLNPRGDSLPSTAGALRSAGHAWEADQLEALANDKMARDEYARATFEAFTKVVPSEKLRFMQYVEKGNYDWWKAQESRGAILLGTYTNKLNGSEPKKKVPAEPLTDEEKEQWDQYKEAVRLNFKTCLSTYVKLGEYLTKIRDMRLYREDYKSFEAYCREELQIARSTAYGYISDFEVTTDLSKISDISNLTKEFHLQPLKQLRAPERQQAFEQLKTLTKDQAALTPEMLKQVALKISRERPVVTPDMPAPRRNQPLTIPREVKDMVPMDSVAPSSEPEAAQSILEVVRQIIRNAQAKFPDRRGVLAAGLREIAASLDQEDIH